MLCPSAVPIVNAPPRTDVETKCLSASVIIIGWCDFHFSRFKLQAEQKQWGFQVFNSSNIVGRQTNSCLSVTVHNKGATNLDQPRSAFLLNFPSYLTSKHRGFLSWTTTCWTRDQANIKNCTNNLSLQAGCSAAAHSRVNLCDNVTKLYPWLPCLSGYLQHST